MDTNYETFNAPPPFLQKQNKKPKTYFKKSDYFKLCLGDIKTGKTVKR